ncbi:ATP-binding cassette domain-containing protein [Paenibacillus sp. N1-5-1-14]|uniref:ATP-binding cassette domain-containing protein n=1 Tax=Paenibacillus radicibacter TaxID=2972488 RepID=UPI0021597B70|nr:ATP-binding cassette domain-containing protein [Paenibacillus radicibacter]MCR8644399.1 ATP-binding cassette domain-containing protein [Paenibacillus radicibacter]
MTFPKGSFTSIVGQSGCGKSTIASLLMGVNQGYEGHVLVGDQELSEVTESSLMANMTMVTHQSYLFKGTVRDNLLMACPNANEDAMFDVLKRVNLLDFVLSEQGLDTQLEEKASNLSGGQRQRLAIARALLHDTQVYIFDEATSNIDMESENDIMSVIHELAQEKTIILISHRLANVVKSNRIYMMQKGTVVEHGTHAELLKQQGAYANLFNHQSELEQYGSAEHKEVAIDA